jgi:hypothetical protein
MKPIKSYGKFSRFKYNYSGEGMVYPQVVSKHVGQIIGRLMKEKHLPGHENSSYTWQPLLKRIIVLDIQQLEVI